MQRGAAGASACGRRSSAPDCCTNLVGAFRLNRPVFGGKQKRALFASFRLNQAADVKLTVTRGGKVVRTTQRKRYAAGKGATLRVTPKGRARGDYMVTISAERAAAPRPRS